MNDILQLKGQFQKRKNPNKVGVTNLPQNTYVTALHLMELSHQLQQIQEFWLKEGNIGGLLVSAHYTRVVPKSCRLQILLGEKGKHPNASIRGARFEERHDNDGNHMNHVFTYFISFDAIERSIEMIDTCADIISSNYSGKITSKDTHKINAGTYTDVRIVRTTFLKVVLDSLYIERFDVDMADKTVKEQSIVTIYKTGVNTVDLLRKLGIDIIAARMIGDTTLNLNPGEVELLYNKAPYLIAMQVKDFNNISADLMSDEEIFSEEKEIKIPAPVNEPIVGVIDTQFDESVYFSKWVSYSNELDTNIQITNEDCFHGTAVSSIIVDGATINPSLDDGCGRFRVKHFGVATAKGFYSFTILKMIRNIVSANSDIKVWNLSLGSAMQINTNFISPEAAELDRIQTEFDVVFIIAGTNKDPKKVEKMRIGSPADSLNSIVVNAVDFSGKPASYTRTGPVLSFFYKPDVCYYGGDKDEKIVVCEPLGRATVSGTSFAAPWITRKMAYLIYILGLNREVAKALIIDSAAGWDRQDNRTFKMGYGIVPKRIEDIIHSENNEIRFLMSGVIDEYETFTYNIPVPRDKGTHPFFARATLVYFPKSDRNQGVDYTSTEMDLHFGRVMEKEGKATIKAINNNCQAEEGLQSLYEENARKLYRKWDNVKHISEELNERAKPRMAYPSGMWGLSIKTKERMASSAGKGLQFGVVVTLREMHGENRIDDFVKLCMVRGWLVNRIDVNNQLDIYQKSEEDLKFE